MQKRTNHENQRADLSSSRSGELKKLLLLTTAVLMLPFALRDDLTGGIGRAWAACADNATGNPAAQATNGSNCTGTRTSYTGTGNNATVRAMTFDANGGSFLRLTKSSVRVTNTNGGFGLHAQSGGSISVDNNLTVTTTGAAAAIRASGNASAPTNPDSYVRLGGKVTTTTSGESAYGLNAIDNGKILIGNPSIGGLDVAGSSSVVISPTSIVTISTSGDQAHGIYARTQSGTSNNSSLISFGTGTTIVTTGDSAEGVYATVQAGTGSSSITMTGGSVSTDGYDSDGLVALVSDTGGVFSTLDGSATVTMSGGSIITKQDASAGIIAETDLSLGTPSKGDATVYQTGGTVETSGTAGSYGILALAQGTGDATVIQANGASVTATGSGADAVRAESYNGNTVVDVAGLVSGGTGGAAGINTITALGQHSDITIRDGAEVGASSGQAVLNNQGNSDVLVEDGAVVTGSISLANGTDNLTLAGADMSGMTVLNGGDDLTSGDGWVDTLTFADVSAKLAGANIRNWEDIVVDGGTVKITDGVLKTGSESGHGLTVRGGGVFNGGNGLALTGNVTIESTGTFTGTGSGGGIYSISGNVVNSGLLTTRDSYVGDRVLVGGNYSGGGVMEVDTNLGDDNSTSDRLEIAGSSSGALKLRVAGADRPGGITSTGIPVVLVNGSSAGSFTLVDGDFTNADGVQSVVGGAYAYTLVKKNGNWYLVSTKHELIVTADPTSADTLARDLGIPVLQPGFGVYENMPQTLQALNRLPTLYQRVGARHQSQLGIGPVDAPQDAITDKLWARLAGEYLDLDVKGFMTRGVKLHSYKLQFGADYQHEEKPLILGINGYVGHSKARIDSTYDNGDGDGDIHTLGFGIGATATWYYANDAYLDLQAQFSRFYSDLSSDALGTLKTDSLGNGVALSAETGRTFTDLKWLPGWDATPQVQLVYSHVKFNDFTARFGEKISMEDGDSLRLRLGLSLDKLRQEETRGRWSHFYGLANVYYEFLDPAKVTLSGFEMSVERDRWWAELAAGGNYSWDDGKYTVYGELGYLLALEHVGHQKGLQATLGLRKVF